MLSHSEFGFTVSSSDIQKASLFNIDGSDRNVVLVWVESLEDKIFWGACLPRLDSIQFDIKIADDIDASDGKAATGCTRLFSLRDIGDLNLGTNLIFCLDSDDRFLARLFPPSAVTEAHIYYTNVYSIENAYLDKLHADRTFESVAACSVRDLTLCPSQLLACISKAVHKTILLLAFTLENFDYHLVGHCKANFLSAISKIGAMDSDIEVEKSEIFSEFKKTLEDVNCELLQNIYDHGLEQLYSEFSTAASSNLIDESNAYLFVRGHDLFNSVTRVFETANKKRKNDEIARVAQKHKGAQDVINAVKNNWKDFGGALKTGFYAATPNVPFFERTITRITEDYRTP